MEAVADPSSGILSCSCASARSLIVPVELTSTVTDSPSLIRIGKHYPELKSYKDQVQESKVVFEHEKHRLVICRRESNS